MVSPGFHGRRARAVLAAFDRIAVTVDKLAERSYARCVRGRRAESADARGNSLGGDR